MTIDNEGDDENGDVMDGDGDIEDEDDVDDDDVDHHGGGGGDGHPFFYTRWLFIMCVPDFHSYSHSKWCIPSSTGVLSWHWVRCIAHQCQVSFTVVVFLPADYCLRPLGSVSRVV